MSQFLEVAVEAAQEAGALLVADFGRPKNVTYKGEVDLVTESDRRSEALVVGRLRSHFPKHAIVGEEGGGGAADGGQYTWFVDPLDGTTNFAHGYPCFAVSIGLVEEGEPLVGVVYNPVSRELFTAERGDGAYLNNKRIHVSPTEKLAKSLVATGFPTHKVRTSVNISYYWEFTLRSHGVRRDGAASLDLCSVAAGRFDAFWEFGLKSWDTAAGMLIVREAGGMVSDLAGRPYHPGDADILASNGRIHAEVQQVAADIAARVRKN
ncbi:MAG TPA: inositol monophosphatase family protein [Candidatus Sulfotelmatobacter sp.]|nr:inositol monophosphatase family protein [Candidatus Sulfotelmatobacter sp.]